MRFIDIHSHILFGVDDGADSPEASLEMISQATEFGVEHILATPHATEVMNEEIGKQFIDRFQDLQKKIEAEKIPAGITLASELFFSELILNWLEFPWATFGGNGKYLLFELPLFDLPDNVDTFIFHCRMKGIIPILAHPERYIRLQGKPDLLLKWYQHGCYMQLNAGSIMGQFGERIKDFAQRLLQSGIYQFLASDAHEVRDRNFETLSRAGEAVSELVSPEYAGQLAYENPRKALKGEKLIVPDSVRIPQKERWYNRYFRKFFSVSRLL